MAKVKVWKDPGWENEWCKFTPRWMVDDGYKTTVADSWNHAITIARRWAGIK